MHDWSLQKRFPSFRALLRYLPFQFSAKRISSLFSCPQTSGVSPTSLALTPEPTPVPPPPKKEKLGGVMFPWQSVLILSCWASTPASFPFCPNIWHPIWGRGWGDHSSIPYLFLFVLTNVSTSLPKLSSFFPISKQEVTVLLSKANVFHVLQILFPSHFYTTWYNQFFPNLSASHSVRFCSLYFTHFSISNCEKKSPSNNYKNIDNCSSYLLST